LADGTVAVGADVFDGGFFGSAANSDARVRKGFAAASEEGGAVVMRAL